MKPFNLEAAKAGKPYTVANPTDRFHNTPFRFLHKLKGGEPSIVSVLTDMYHHEQIVFFREEALCMLPETITRYVVTYTPFEGSTLSVWACNDLESATEIAENLRNNNCRNVLVTPITIEI